MVYTKINGLYQNIYRCKGWRLPVQNYTYIFKHFSNNMLLELMKYIIHARFLQNV